jgi:hypothetical protein
LSFTKFNRYAISQISYQQMITYVNNLILLQLVKTKYT